MTTIDQILQKLEQMDASRQAARSDVEERLDSIGIRIGELTAQVKLTNGRVSAIEQDKIIASAIVADRRNHTKRYMALIATAATIITSLSAVIANILTSR